MKKKSFFSFLLFLALCYIIAGLGSFATDTSLTPWYVELKKSNWNPPAWVFAPVWTILYFLIAIAGWLLFTAESSKKRTQALLFYFLQLTCNGIWSFLFFYFQSPLLGLFDIFFLAFFLFMTILLSLHVSKPAAWILLPYFFWTLYAFFLNGSIVYLNM